MPDSQSSYVRRPPLYLVDSCPKRLVEPLRARGRIVWWRKSVGGISLLGGESLVVIGETVGGAAAAVRGLRAQGCAPTDHPPAVIVVAPDRREAAVAFACGADAVVLGMERVSELAARIDAVGRRIQPAAFRVGSLELDVLRRLALVGERDIRVTHREFDLLHALASQPGHLHEKSDLRTAIWHSHGPRSRALERHVDALRTKLGTTGPRIVTVWGIGYRLDARA